jgi:hypothetical protein
MPRTCSICRNININAINAALVSREPLRNIAQRFETSSAALFRHGRDHIPVLLARAESRSQESAGTLAGQVKTLEGRMTSFLNEAQEVIDEAKVSGDPRLRLTGIKEGVGAIRSMTPLLELRGRVSGELAEKPVRGPAVQVVILLPEKVEAGAPPTELMRYQQQREIENQTLLGPIIDVEPIIDELEQADLDPDAEDEDTDEFDPGE